MKLVSFFSGSLASLLLFVSSLGRLQAEPTPFVPARNWPGAELFTNGPVLRLELFVSQGDLQKLGQQPRDFVRGKLVEGGTVYSNVALHLKGSVGSFRPVEDKPALTLDFSRLQRTQKFHGLRRIHLNNSVEDPSYLNELVGGEMFRAAGVPAPRVGHALLTLNGRPLGLYILKEAFTEDFLACYFKSVGGELFEPEEGHDIDQPMKRNSIRAPRKETTARQALADAALDPEPGRRWQRLEQTLDLERFIDFMALEVMLCHRDGYTMARNNFRIYQDLDSGRIMFFPQGMDQLFGRADLPWQPQMAGLVARGVIGTSEGRHRYRQQFSLLLTNLFRPEQIMTRIDQVLANLQPSLSQMEFAPIVEEASQLKQRIKDRRLNLFAQLNRPELAPLAFRDGMARPGPWSPVDAAPGSKLDRIESDGVQALHIVAQGPTSASWRTEVLLEHGDYQFVGRARTAGVTPLPYGRHKGAALRLGGETRPFQGLTGTAPWQDLAVDISINTSAEKLELVCELRANAGEAWFDLDSLRLIKKN